MNSCELTCLASLPIVTRNTWTVEAVDPVLARCTVFARVAGTLVDIYKKSGRENGEFEENPDGSPANVFPFAAPLAALSDQIEKFSRGERLKVYHSRRRS